MDNENNQSELILLSLQGEDKPGLTNEITKVLAEHNVDILDIGQAVIHNDLSLGILISITDETDDSSSILKDLLFKAYGLGLNIKFRPIPRDDYEEWVTQQGKKRNIVTLMARRLSGRHIAEVTRIIREQGLNIDKISRLTGRRSLQVDNSRVMSVVEFSVRGEPLNSEKLRLDFIEASKNLDIDIAFQADNIFRRNRRLVCFDMDSTLIQTEVIDELARKAGVYEQVSAITASAMRGEIDFKQSFMKRISLLKGLDESVMREIAENLPLTDGVERLFNTLKRYGYKTAILSGGFTYFGNYLKQKLNIDYVFANELEIVDGKLTGKHLGDIVDGAKKAELLRLLAFKEDIHLEQCIAVGDGANDLPMIQEAGLGIAFHAKPKVKATAAHSISQNGLDTILYLIGFRDREINS
ncbi:MAG: phosphoserine phosphatase SerB [Bacteroidales bacterium]|nr:phosphoserine phosphatase SerB [Bacteroidales bacterium]